MDARIRAIAKQCKNRGGDCPCVGKCEAVEAIERQVGKLEGDRLRIKRQVDDLETTKRRLLSSPATLAEGFTFDARYQPVMVFDGDEASFGYEDSDGEWIDAGVWPFNESYVWYDDCERLGIRVEQA